MKILTSILALTLISASSLAFETDPKTILADCDANGVHVYLLNKNPLTGAEGLFINLADGPFPFEVSRTIGPRGLTYRGGGLELFISNEMAPGVSGKTAHPASMTNGEDKLGVSCVADLAELSKD